MTPLVISHSIFLKTAERLKLMHSPATIETVGITVTVKSPNTAGEKLTEIFCRYLLTNEIVGPEIELMGSGYKFYIPSTREWKPILDSPEDTTWLYYEVELPIKVNDKKYLAIHQVVVQDVTDLERSTICENLARYLNKPMRAAP